MADDTMTHARQSLKLRHLQALVSVDSHSTVQAAAQELSRTPSAVSKSISELEAIIGARLFERTRGGLVATPAAERLLVQINRGLLLLGDALEQATGAQEGNVASAVTLGVLPTAASSLAPGAVLRFQDMYPETVVRVIEGTNIDLLKRLREGTLDVVVGRLAEASMMFDLSFEPLFEEPLVLVAANSHPLVGQRALGVSQVYSHPVILPQADTIIRATLDPVLIARGGQHPPRSIETLSDAFARYLVAQSHAVWFCAPGVVSSDLEDGRFVPLDFDLRATRRSVGLSMRSDTPLDGVASQLVEQLRVQARLLRGA